MFFVLSWMLVFAIIVSCFLWFIVKALDEIEIFNKSKNLNLINSDIDSINDKINYALTLIKKYEE